MIGKNKWDQAVEDATELAAEYAWEDAEGRADIAFQIAQDPVLVTAFTAILCLQDLVWDQEEKGKRGNRMSAFGLMLAGMKAGGDFGD